MGALGATTQPRRGHSPPGLRRPTTESAGERRPEEEPSPSPGGLRVLAAGALTKLRPSPPHRALALPGPWATITPTERNGKAQTGRLARRPVKPCHGRDPGSYGKAHSSQSRMKIRIYTSPVSAVFL